jgi:pentapeptide MXKDX repeat protein
VRGGIRPSHVDKTQQQRIRTMVMKLVLSALSAVAVAAGLAFGAPALAQTKTDAMSNDSMSKDGMPKSGMAKDGMNKDSMSKGSMSKGSMSKDSMSKDSMTKDNMSKQSKDTMKK